MERKKRETMNDERIQRIYEALSRISYGIYVVSSRSDSEINGQIVNSLFGVIPNPPTVAVSISKANLTHEYVQSSRVFSPARQKVISPQF